MRGFNFDKHQESEINLVSHFPAEEPPSRQRHRVCCGIFRKQLAPDTVGNPSHFGMGGREGGGEAGNQRMEDGGASACFPCGRNPLTSTDKRFN